MQYTTLFTLLTLLATSFSTDARDLSSPNRLNGKRAHREHARNAATLAAQVERREYLASVNPRALEEKPVRKVMKRGAGGCRVKGTNATLSSVSSAAAITGATTSVVVNAASTTSAVNIVNANFGVDGTTASSTYVAPASSAAPAATSAASSGGGQSVSVNGSPSGIKAGGAGSDTLSYYGSHTSWWFNYGSVADGGGSQLYIPMLWGNGAQGSQDASRLASFQAMSSAPAYVFGFYEPDCLAPMSSDIDPTVAAALWMATIAPWRSQGTTLISPGMCKQMDETWLEPFLNVIGQSNIWDYTQIHTNKNTLQGVKDDVAYYYNKYGKPVWVNEFACVDDQNGFTPCSDQGQINSFINDVVDFFEGDYRVVAYAMSEGEGLGETWPPYRNGGLTESGQTYLNAISKYH